MLGHTSRVSFSHQNKGKSSSTLMSRNEWFFSLTERLHSTINTLTMSYFIYNWPNTFTIHVLKSTAVELLLFMKSQFAREAQNFRHPNQRTHGQIRSWTVALFQRSRVCKWFDRHKKYVGDGSLRFQIELSSQGCLIVPTDKNLKDWSQYVLVI